MARRVHALVNDVESLKEALSRHFDRSPLFDIGEAIRGQLQLMGEFDPPSELAPATISGFVRACRRIMECIPSANLITERFWFDSAMIQAVVSEWSTPDSLIPRSIVARCGSEWSYGYDWLPNLTAERMPRIDVVDFPGESNLQSIALLTYPWLYHEVGHLLMKQHGIPFRQRIGEEINQIQNNAAHRTLGLSEAVKRRHRSLRERFDLAWRPMPTQADWSHEIAIDIVALWCTGPAFLGAFADELEGKQAFLTGQSHPPYEIRAYALREAGNRLMWESEARELDVYLEKVRKDSNSTESDNDYAAVFDREFVQYVVTHSLQVCVDLSLPRCNQASVAKADALLEGNQTPEFGTPLVLAAYRRYQRDPNSYHDWEKRVVRELVDQVMR